MESSSPRRVTVAIVVAAAATAGGGLAAIASDAKAPPDQPVTRRVSKTPDRGDPNGPSVLSAVSGDCTAVAFASTASNLTDADPVMPANIGQIYLRDRGRRAVTLVSASTTGTPGNAASDWPAVSADGTFVAFQSYADNLVAGDDNGSPDIFLFSASTGRLALVSRTPGGSPGENGSFVPTISASGRFVAFASTSSDLVADDTNEMTDVFRYDRRDRSVRRVSVATDGSQSNDASTNPSISGDGRHVAFESAATNLDPADTSSRPDIYRRDVARGRTTLVSVGTMEAPGNGLSNTASISGDGRYVAFRSTATDLTPDTVAGAAAYVRDLRAGTTDSVSRTAADAPLGAVGYYGVRISKDGTRATFTTSLPGAAKDTNADHDVYLRNLHRDHTKLISVSSSRAAVSGTSFLPSIDDHGRCVSFASDAAELVGGDQNGLFDVFLRRLKQVAR